MAKVTVLVDVTDPENVFVHKGYGKDGWMRKGRTYLRVELSPLPVGARRNALGAPSLVINGESLNS
jgi:hypothetical protein